MDKGFRCFKCGKSFYITNACKEVIEEECPCPICKKKKEDTNGNNRREKKDWKGLEKKRS